MYPTYLPSLLVPFVAAATGAGALLVPPKDVSTCWFVEEALGLAQSGSPYGGDITSFREREIKTAGGMNDTVL